MYQQNQQLQGSSISHETYSESNNPSSLQYPYYPPYDNEVDFY